MNYIERNLKVVSEIINLGYSVYDQVNDHIKDINLILNKYKIDINKEVFNNNGNSSILVEISRPNDNILFSNDDILFNISNSRIGKREIIEEFYPLETRVYIRNNSITSRCTMYLTADNLNVYKFENVRYNYNAFIRTINSIQQQNFRRNIFNNENMFDNKSIIDFIIELSSYGDILLCNSSNTSDDYICSVIKDVLIIFDATSYSKKILDKVGENHDDLKRAIMLKHCRYFKLK